MEKRNTKQKELILEVLSRNENMFHPTAQDIVRIVLDRYPNIGQATVYRNINKLVEEGSLLRIPTTDNIRYDINTHTHAHFSCKICGSITDLYDNNYQDINKNIESKYNIIIEETNVIYNGVCEECNGKV